MTQVEIVTRLEEAAMSLTESSVRVLKVLPQGTPVLCAAFVLQASGKTTMMGISDPSERIDILREYARAMGDVVGFALIFDGYVSYQCQQCRGRGCDQCVNPKWGDRKKRVDAIIAVVRTMWGSGSTKSVAYGYTEGQFRLIPERNEDAPYSASETLDSYAEVFKPATVN